MQLKIGGKVNDFLFFMLFFQVQAPSQNFAALDAKFKRYQKQFGNNAVLMISDDTGIIYTRQLGDFTINTPEKIASGTKWLSAACVMTLVDDGKINLDDPVAKFVSAFNKPGF